MALNGLICAEVPLRNYSLIQGSGVGPVAFLIYIDDLAKLLESYDVIVSNCLPITSKFIYK